MNHLFLMGFLWIFLLQSAFAQDKDSLEHVFYQKLLPGITHFSQLEIRKQNHTYALAHQGRMVTVFDYYTISSPDTLKNGLTEPYVKLVLKDDRIQLVPLKADTLFITQTFDKAFVREEWIIVSEKRRGEKRKYGFLNRLCHPLTEVIFEKIYLKSDPFFNVYYNRIKEKPDLDSIIGFGSLSVTSFVIIYNDGHIEEVNF